MTTTTENAATWNDFIDDFCDEDWRQMLHEFEQVNDIDHLDPRGLLVFSATSYMKISPKPISLAKTINCLVFYGYNHFTKKYFASMHQQQDFITF